LKKIRRSAKKEKFKKKTLCEKFFFLPNKEIYWGTFLRGQNLKENERKEG